ncbi:MAG: alpha/beta fold hydrolase [Candidatus Promineifilaceae bacterium]|nr:alpha/beta fold hydrolase [Candidatus Promineifilaceae bacterium]
MARMQRDGERRLYRIILLPALLALLLLGACGDEGAPATPSPAGVSQRPAEDGPFAGAGTSTPTSTATAATPPTATPIPSPSPSATVVPSPTSTPTPTATPVHPLDIAEMRRQSYPGSELVFERTLTPGDNYERHVVSYLSEGNKIYALLTIPRGERPASGWPVVIFNHGYIPPEIYRTTERYVAYVHAFARSGYIVFRSDYRGHGSSEGEATGGYGTPAYTIDVLNGMASVLRHPDADPERVGMWGHSMGGQITLRAMVVNDQIDAGVIWAGVVASYPDLLVHWTRPGPTRTPDPQRTRPHWRRELPERYGAPEENPTFWAAISPNTYVADLSGPIQLHHGSDDTSVPIVISDLFFAELEAAGVPVEYYQYEGDDHNISENLWLALNRSVEFFDRYVKDGGS